MKPITSITREVIREFMINKKCCLTFVPNGQEKMWTNQYSFNKIMHLPI